MISAKLFEGIELIKCLRYLSSVWVRLSIFSQLSILRYVVLCVVSLPISLVMIEIIYIYILCLIIIIKSEIWSIIHCLGLARKTMICIVCLSIFLYIYIIYIYNVYMPYLWWYHTCTEYIHSCLAINCSEYCISRHLETKLVQKIINKHESDQLVSAYKYICQASSRNLD